ncbi:MAG: S41 family peptidase [Elusimicrobia bacterium]|nr:S41 family peptidase [Candidatus Liberimonas magnetica]
MKKTVLIGAMMVFVVLGAARFRVFAAEDKTYDQLKLLVDVMSLIQDNYVENKESKQLIVGSIKGMVKTLDPFSQFMEPEAYKEMSTETQGEFGGLGIRLSYKDGWPTVITPLPGTPAYRIGVLPDDKIVKIEGKSTKDSTLEDVVNKLRGKPGTKVTISIARDSFKEPVDYTIVRQIIKIETIRSKMLANNIGYIHLSEFNANSDKDLDKALMKLKEEGMKSLIFDLRNNPGGLLDVAVDVCKHFLGDDKLIVYTQGRNPDSRREYRSRGKADYGDIPMVVLVNRGSASGSEIVAGAMQDLKRALIVGATTFGKASVQSVFPVEDGNALRLTTAKYYTPLGRGIHRDETTGKGGIAPDIILEIPNEVEAKLYAQAEEIFAPGKEPKPAVKETEIIKDVVLERAIELLKAREIFFAAPKQ